MGCCSGEDTLPINSTSRGYPARAELPLWECSIDKCFFETEGLILKCACSRCCEKLDSGRKPRLIVKNKMTPGQISPYPMMVRIINAATHPSPCPTLFLTPCPGIPFCMSEVEDALTELQLVMPHSHPLGQQSPPKVAAQLVHPRAQFCVVELMLVAAGPTGTTTVTPPVIIVVELVGGQSLVWQSLPVLQQSP